MAVIVYGSSIAAVHGSLERPDVERGPQLEPDGAARGSGGT